ncbi:type II toxin-antitoxin system ParD family antitoxin [Neogemmobacter tilapiae]|uniref:Addiction module antitoxin n=1 Tax=Neogemmobacter tilapiae TaxID=875041 RepID=A0A918WJJ6_9RHOB|nr:type II toxin-antitoxin system ParD family antitoxin [Gemmobacter tilapiae]GHC57563.1 addiction module antitoxin [Gemmobacter tilapiae]
MPTRNVVLTDHQSEFVDALVASGRYQNASEAMRSGLRLLEREEAAWEEVRKGVLEGLAQVERGEFAQGTPEEIFERAFNAGISRAKISQAS